MKENSPGQLLFDALNVSLMLFLSFICLYPLLYVLFASCSNPLQLISHQGILIAPLEFTTSAYNMVFENPMILKGYGNTLFVVVFGVAVNILLTSFGAYFLSRKDIVLRNVVMRLIVFTMFFNGGLIPFYFTVKQLGIDNSYLALIFPVAINTFNLIIMTTAFKTIPESLEESAKLDGANHFRILFSIVLPLSRAVLAVIMLYYAVGHWNSWFNAMLFLRQRDLYPLQLILREILIQNDTSSMTASISATDQQAIGESVKYATVIIATLPILCVYPFLQKYFEKGVMIGAVKG